VRIDAVRRLYPTHVFESERVREIKIKRYMKETIKQQIQKALCRSTMNQLPLDTDLLVVAQTGRYMSFNTLTKKLGVLSNKVNKILFGKNFKSLSAHERIVMTYFNQNSPKLHTHSHLLLSIPNTEDRHNVLTIMDTCWRSLQDDNLSTAMFKIYYEEIKDLDSRVANVIYASRQLRSNYADNEFGMF